MAILYGLTPELRRKLKKPIGALIRGSFAETIEKLKKLAVQENPLAIISVGDAVSKNLAENSIFPKLSIVDNKVMRREIQSVRLEVDKTLYAENPPGTITEDAIEKIQEAMNFDCRVKIVVNGEEDLLALAAILYAPENSFVVYGQPNEGIVVVRTTKQKKAEITELLEAMETFRNTK